MISRSATFPRGKKKKRLISRKSYATTSPAGSTCSSSRMRRVTIPFVIDSRLEPSCHRSTRTKPLVPPSFPRIPCALAAPSTPERRGRRHRGLKIAPLRASPPPPPIPCFHMWAAVNAGLQRLLKPLRPFSAAYHSRGLARCH